MVKSTRTLETIAEYKRKWAEQTDAPYGYCWCGCGEKTNPAPQSHAGHGWLKAEPVRFLRSHGAKPHTERRIFTNTEEREICARYEASEHPDELAVELGINRTTVYDILKRCGVLTLSDRGRIDKIAILASYESGKSSYAIARKLGTSSDTVRRILKEEGVPMRDASSARRVYQCDHLYFDRIDTEAKAYWLGFIAADGCVTNEGRTVQITLAAKDADHLRRFASDLGSGHPVSFGISKGYTLTESARITITSPTLGKGLIAHGVHPRKTFTLRWPDTVSPILMRHYLRGYFDGDGSWSFGKKQRLWSWSIAGTFHTCNGARAFLMENAQLNKVKIGRHSRSKICRLGYGGNLQIPRLAHLLYDDATVYLPRKRDKVAHLL